jgi:glycyl-tRNA synthetase beta chain
MSSTNQADFLVEIHTEELPPKALLRLSEAFAKEIEDRITKAGLSFTDKQIFATPRRLAFLVNKLDAKQIDASIERKGPALSAAFDKEGKPTPACLGFAKSCGVTPEQLTTLKTDAGTWVGFQQHVPGKTVQELLPLFVQQAVSALPIPKRMRWGNNTVEFVRPVHSVIMLYGKDIIDATILGCKTDRRTQGHRFLSSGWLEVTAPADYAPLLEKQGYVIADFSTRKEKIRNDAIALCANVSIQEELLTEVTGLVEWPVAIMGTFDKNFLEVPQEALISAMQDHQRYFPVIDAEGKLLPQFITISNIASKNVQQVITGNERVLRARLSDAAFFYDVDKKITLEARLENLKTIIFQAKLGTMHDKATRLSKTAEYLANKMALDPTLAKRAGLLAKTDLTSQLVSEFPELQGIAGSYFARNDNEDSAVANALYEQYMPRFSGDKLPETSMGCAVALADRVDTLVGVFGINQQPTSEKDPFGLRRAALGVLRILIEKSLPLDLQDILQFAASTYAINLENKQVSNDVLNFMLERLKPWYQEQGISPDVFASVAALNLTTPFDIHRRIQAVQAFKKMSAAESLSVANKRVSNILSQYKETIALNHIDEKLFEHEAEKTLAAQLMKQQQTLSTLSAAANYQEALSQLADLREPVDNFFNHVMVMTDDQARRENRLLLLKKLRELFLNVADIALLQ